MPERRHSKSETTFLLCPSYASNLKGFDLIKDVCTIFVLEILCFNLQFLRAKKNLTQSEFLIFQENDLMYGGAVRIAIVNKYSIIVISSF